ncbi:PH and SEC7 domain-containing protein 4 [Nothobranchius furzeri]|uniref:PH and SEC7 domain-containing protein 4-like n=4 Tax=Nothobranchius TaxID=28779 RepID=A0A8C6PAB9_NOTFU|nr:transcript variant X1 [Nothobranchius furzeri]KAF7217145.1 transcript variant X2 [Nothobranchius furzeri]
MEEENSCSSLPDIVEAVLHQDSQTLADQPCINGEQSFVVWGESEVQTCRTEETNEVTSSSKTGCTAPEEAEQYEELIWTPQPITCSSPPFSVAMVKWDTPDSSTETPLLTDSCLANELDLGTLNGTSHRLQGLIRQEEEEDEDILNSAIECFGINPKLLLSGLCCNVQPCDAADVKEAKTQEKEDSAHEELERSDEIQQTPTKEVTDPAEDVRGLEGVVDTFIDPKQEEEHQVILLTGQEDSEGERSSGNDEESSSDGQQRQSLTCAFCGEERTLVEDGSKLREEQSVTNVYNEEERVEAETVRDGEALVEPVPVDSSVLNVPTGELIDPEEPPGFLENDEHSEEEEEKLKEDLTTQNEEFDMHDDADQNVKLPEAAANNEEAAVQEAENPEKLENPLEREEGTVNLQETSRLEQQECDQTAFRDPEQPEQAEEQVMAERIPAENMNQSQELEISPEMELRDQSTQSENTEKAEGLSQPEQSVCAAMEITEQSEQTNESETTEQLSPESEVSQQMEEADLNQVDQPVEMLEQAEDTEGVMANGEQRRGLETAYMNGGEVDRVKARRLAERLFNLEEVERADVVKHLDKDNAFSRAVGEEYLTFFDFTDQTLDQALRSFLMEVLLIGESQERERVLQHFSNRFHQCNPDTYASPGAVLALTCALMLLNTDLHGQIVGKSMSCYKFVSNLDGMNEGENFNKDLLKSVYNSIKSKPLEWAVDEEELKNLVDENTEETAPLRSKSNPFQDVPYDKTAPVVKEGFLQRKLHADINGKRTPWGKRGWKTFYGVLKGMVLSLQKSDYRRDQTACEEVVSVHHSLAEQAAEYTKRPHVFRLQTADWRIFLFQASSELEMNLWISRINLVSALRSSPPFPSAVGSQRRFFRPILPASQSAHPLERQLQFHKGKLESFKADLLNQEENVPDPKKAKARDLEEHRLRTEYLHHEVCRYEIYIQMLEAWESVKLTDHQLSAADLNLFDKVVCADTVRSKEPEEPVLKRSHSSPSLELEIAAPVIKVKRNVSERRTYRKTVVPRRNKEA